MRILPNKMYPGKRNKSALAKARHSLKTDFNKYIRLRDTKGKRVACISCDKAVQYGTHDCQAGHFYPGIAIYRALEFNEINVNVQCFKCNFEKQGNWEGYKKGMIKKYGPKVLERLEIQAHNKSNLDVAMCQILKKSYRQKWQKLEQEYSPKFKL